jgi:hypothetical protein
MCSMQRIEKWPMLYMSLLRKEDLGRKVGNSKWELKGQRGFVRSYKDVPLEAPVRIITISFDSPILSMYRVVSHCMVDRKVMFVQEGYTSY